MPPVAKWHDIAARVPIIDRSGPPDPVPAAPPQARWRRGADRMPYDTAVNRRTSGATVRPWTTIEKTTTA